jgi:hypothetical protein
MKRIYVSTLVSAAAGIAAVGLIAGCSSSGSGSNASGPTSSAAATGAAAYSAYTQCLSQHGVTLPSRGAFTGARRSHSPGAGGFSFSPGARRSGGFGGGGGGGFGGFASADPSMSAAMQACSALRPTGAPGFGGGGGGGFGGGSTRLAAFRSCMSQQGEVIPTTRPTARITPAPTGDARYLGGLNPSDPKVAAALNVCKPLIPTASASPSASAT